MAISVLFYRGENRGTKKFCVLPSVSMFVTIEIRTFQFIEINRANGYAFFPSNFSLSGEKQPLNNFGPADCKTCFWLHILSITSAYNSGKEKTCGEIKFCSWLTEWYLRNMSRGSLASLKCHWLCWTASVSTRGHVPCGCAWAWGHRALPFTCKASLFWFCLLLPNVCWGCLRS